MRLLAQSKMAQLLLVDYIQCRKDGYVTPPPLTPYDKWDGEMVSDAVTASM